MTTIRRLHVGGKVRVPGWEVFNAIPAPEVDHVGNAGDPQWIERLATATVDAFELDHWEAQKNRLRKKTRGGQELAVSLDRGTFMRDGDDLQALFLGRLCKLYGKDPVAGNQTDLLHVILYAVYYLQPTLF